MQFVILLCVLYSLPVPVFWGAAGSCGSSGDCSDGLCKGNYNFRCSGKSSCFFLYYVIKSKIIGEYRCMSIAGAIWEY